MTNMSKNVEKSPEQSAEGGSSSAKKDQDSRFLWTIFLFFLVPMCLYLWDGEEAVVSATDIVINKVDIEDAPNSAPTIRPTKNKKPTRKGGGKFGKGCSDICTRRESSRKEKFGGDLLDFQDVLKLAEGAHEKVISKLREDYGEYFEPMFVNGTNGDGGTNYNGMRPADLGGPSRDRMKRKMKIKVLKMMTSIQETDSNVNGCDCIGKTGSADSNADDSFATAIPDYYEKYVFANGGHSNAAGHGNMYSESYTAVFGRDVRPIFEAIGISLETRNNAMGGMR